MTGVARKQDLNINPKVRFIAKIRSSSHPDGLSNSWISVNNILRDGVFSHSLSFSLGDHPLATSNRMGPCVVDYCYDQNEKNDVVFEREVKPSIDEVFDGCNATIIACGASGSGKSYLFQGTNDEPGLIVLAVNGMLRLAANNRKSVAASFYEVDHDHNVKDLLDPNRQVFVLKDAHGKTQLKGLSQVLVTSMSQFHNFYGRATNSRKSIPERSHKGLILYVSSDVGEKLNVVVSKLNFVDLAGYQDARNKSLDGHNLAESTTNINKSIHVMHNVLYSLKANETHVPYRESKITNMLQDSLRGTGRILMVTCLNPSFCHDSINMVRLASRSCQGTSWAITDSSKKANSLARPMVPSSHKIWMHGSASTSARKQTMSRGHIYRNKAHCSTSTMKAGKLFGESSDLKSQKTGDDNSKIALSTAVPSHSLCNECGLPPLSAQLQEIVNKLRSICSSIPSCMDTTPHNDGFHTATSTDIAELTTLKSNMRTDDDNNKIAVSTRELPMFDEGKKIGKESSCSICNLDRSALHIKEFEEIVNNMKSICSSTSSCIDIPPHDDALHAQTSTDIGEPATLNSSMGVSDRDITSFSTWEKFIAGSTGMKNSLAQDYLRLLNTADKEVLQKLKGIGEKRATYILELREDNPEPFKNLDDLKVIGLSAKQHGPVYYPLLLAHSGPSSNVRVERVLRDCFSDGGALADVMSLYENMIEDNLGDNEKQTTEAKEQGSYHLAIEGVMKMPDLAVEALALTIRHLKQFGFDRMLCLGASFRPFSSNMEMNLSANTLQQLEVLRNNSDGSESGSLLHIMNLTLTIYGSRLLRHWNAWDRIKILSM